MARDYSKFINAGPFISLKDLFLNCINKIRIDNKESLTELIKALPSYLYRWATMYDLSIPYYRSDKSMKVSIYYNENGKTLQEIIELFFEEYCISLR